MKETKSDGRVVSESYREALRAFLTLASSGETPSDSWSPLVREGIGYLGGQADRRTTSLADYDHHRDGPYLGISDEGSAADAVREAAYSTGKAVALGKDVAPLRLGLGLDAERLGSIGEVPVGPDEYAHVWARCAGRLAMTTNVGSRANVRFYKRAPLVVIPADEDASELKQSRAGVAAAFKPFFEALGGARPVVVYLEFEVGKEFSPERQLATLNSLVAYVKEGRIADPKIQRLGLKIQIGWETKGRDAAIKTIDLAQAAGIDQVAIDGLVRKEADEVVSLPGLLNYLEPKALGEVLEHAQARKVQLNPINIVDPGTVAREIWTGLNAARAMGLDLGKYGLAPLTLEECDRVVELIQGWFPDWSAAPVFYVDQGVLSRDRVFVGADLVAGLEAWLQVMAKHRVRIVLIDTVEKAKSWKILKTDGDPKGILLPEQIAHLNDFAAKLGIRTLWAGGITLDHAYLFGKLGVFGLYVTSAASSPAPVGCQYQEDVSLPVEKEPTREGVFKVKTVLEAGFLSERLTSSPKLQQAIRDGGTDEKKLAGVLPEAWTAWWKQLEQERTNPPPL